MENNELRTLINSRRQIKAQITRFNTYISKYEQGKQMELEIRLGKIDPLFEEYNNIQSEIELLDTTTDQAVERENFEQKFFSAVAAAKTILSQHSNAQTQQNIPNNSPANDLVLNSFAFSNSKLPNLSLPKFSGEYEKWTQFFETFQTLVHNNPCLDNIQKFYHLLGCLEGDARRVLECLEITRDNYIIALELLEKRFKNKPVIIQSHLKALVDMLPVNRESASLLRNLNENVEKHIRALKSLGEPVETWDRIIIFIIGRKLDSDTRKEWEQKTITHFNSDPKLADFTEFLSNKCNILETVDSNLRYAKRPANPRPSNERCSYVITENAKCELCKGAHFVYQCERLLNLVVADRINEIKRLKLCLNCLRPNHFIRHCKSSGCKKCRGRHNTVLHIERIASTSNDQTNREEYVETLEANTDNVAITATSCHLGKPRHTNHIILSTAMVYIKNRNDNFIKCRALLDSGSQINFITKRLIENLELDSRKIELHIAGINQMLTRTNQESKTLVKSLYNNYSTEIQFVVLDNITTALPIQSFDSSKLHIPSNLRLADPEFNVSGEIDLLIGAGHFFEFLCAGQIKLGPQLPVLQKSVLGWIVSGPLLTCQSDKQNEMSVCNLTVEQSIHKQLERFWEVEECHQDEKGYSKEEEECEKIFVETTTRDVSGRFCVSLPLRDNIKYLGDSSEAATNRFYALEKRLLKYPELQQKYFNFMQEYLDLGHMVKIKDEEVETENNVYYLPHHGVLNDSSLTTKLRVVFDGSAKTSSGLSLNDVQRVGPKIQEDLLDILLRFRQYEVVITADIAKMYRQVNVSVNQRDLQRILWRSNPLDKLEHFRLNTITYGTASASFLATRCLKQIAIEVDKTSSEISEVISRNFYVDDLLTGASSVEHAIKIGQGVSSTLNSYGFPLRKWSSNKNEVLRALVKNQPEGDGYLITEGDSKKTLGIFWKSQLDNLEYVVKNDLPNLTSVTKRSILSIISQIFDPLGLVGPVTIRGKILLQRLWVLGLNWDESIPLELFTSWNEIYNQLSMLNEIQIPRKCIIENCKYLELHGFCDASEAAYGTCIYLRTLNHNGEILTRLLCAKSRVAPLKSISLPRLELCGATLLARLARRVISALDVKFDKIYLWSDSTIVLSWLSGQPNNWKVFVANRVAEIHELTSNYEWGHVISSHNPADIISRGLTPRQLLESRLWWDGPKWLMQLPQYWPKNDNVQITSTPDRRVVKLTLHTVVDSSIFMRFSTLYKLKRIVALCYRFLNNIKTRPGNRAIGQLSLSELDNAMFILIKIMQEQVYSQEITALKKDCNVHNQSKIKSLDPFLDDKGLVRVGGRLRHSNASDSAKCPIVLPQKHPLTRLIIRDCHLKHLHAGAQAILCALRQTYWPVNGRNAVRSVLSKCMICFRIRPQNIIQKMGNLPKDRVVPNRPFSISGIDFAGPFNLKDGKTRNRIVIKGYMCLFVCFATKAVHIELVNDLSTHSFLNCLKRFIARRGNCARIYSDNATNFRGAENELQKIFNFISQNEQDNDILEFCAKNCIEWKHIPPRSPHQGGLWEAAIKSAKHHVKRAIGSSNLTFEDLCTIFTQVEAVLNSRPLTPLSNDPNDLSVLTPGHFLIGDALTAPPQKDVREAPMNRLDHYNQLQQMVQLFWTRWSHEYLTTLQQRSKWQQSRNNSISIGAMVLLKDDNTPPLNWKLGRVVSLHPGNLIRVVSVRVNGGTVKRAINKLCLLPINEDVNP